MCSILASTRRRAAERSASLFRNVECVAHHSPHPLGVDPHIQRLVRRAATELGEHMIMSQCGGPHRTELLIHPLPEMGYPHFLRLWARPQGYRDGVFSQSDPIGLSSTAGQLVILFGMLAALVVLIRWWWQQRGR
jgi:hypothetical protein